MSKDAKPDLNKRDIGEKVKLSLGLESATTKDLGSGVLEAIITTSSVDRHNENIDVKGITYKDYMNNPVVLWGHDYEGLPIGKAIKLTKQAGEAIKARFQLAVEEYPFAATVYEMIKSGYINAVSIGGVVKEWSEDYRTINKMEMVEFSIVPVPANPEALITSRSLEQATGKSVEQITKEFAEFNKSVVLDKLSDMSENEIDDAVKVLKGLTARLEESAKGLSLNDDKTKKSKRLYVLADAKRVAEQSQSIIRTIKVTIK